jgi:hypothetical protein
MRDLRIQGSASKSMIPVWFWILTSPSACNGKQGNLGSVAMLFPATCGAGMPMRAVVWRAVSGMIRTPTGSVRRVARAEGCLFSIATSGHGGFWTIVVKQRDHDPK